MGQSIDKITKKGIYKNAYVPDKWTGMSKYEKELWIKE